MITQHARGSLALSAGKHDTFHLTIYVGNRAENELYGLRIGRFVGCWPAVRGHEPVWTSPDPL